MNTSLDLLQKRVKETQKETQKYFQRLKKRVPKKLDEQVGTIHDEVFENTDCLTCANCCKTTGPMFTPKDVERIAKYLKMSLYDFESQYLTTDEDNHQVLQSLPCSFLDQDNHCSIYEVRPKACREFPHTDRKKFHQLTELTLKNVAVCPAAFEIVEKMKERVALR
jgi:Fe-S-cluster containining protein